MQYTLRLLDKYAPHLPLAVGHVIQCLEFASGLKWKSAPDQPIHVAWIDDYANYHIKNGKAESANDPTRAQARFLVFSISLIEAEGADDVFPNSYRYSRDVVCIRMNDNMRFSSESERIRFSLNEPMSIAQPKESSIEILGFAQLPIFWDGVCNEYLA